MLLFSWWSMVDKHGTIQNILVAADDQQNIEVLSGQSLHIIIKNEMVSGRITIHVVAVVDH